MKRFKIQDKEEDRGKYGYCIQCLRPIKKPKYSNTGHACCSDSCVSILNLGADILSTNCELNNGKLKKK